MTRVLHYGPETFVVSETPDQTWQGVYDDITAARAVRSETGGWVDIGTDRGVVTILVSDGIPIWFETRSDSETSS